MLGAYSNIKNRFFANGGERESPFLEELRDESVVREMEEWNFGQVGTVCGLFMGGLRVLSIRLLIWKYTIQYPCF